MCKTVNSHKHTHTHTCRITEDAEFQFVPRSLDNYTSADTWSTTYIYHANQGYLIQS